MRKPTFYFAPGLSFPSHRAEQTYLAYLMEAFIQEGCEVHLFPLGLLTRQLTEQYTLSMVPHIHPISIPSFPRLRAFLYVWQVTRFASRYGHPDYYYCNYAPIAASLIMLKNLGIVRGKVIYDTAAFRSFRLGWLYDRLDDVALRQADLIIPRTTAMADLIAQTLKIPHAKLLPLHNAVKLELFENLPARRRRVRAILHIPRTTTVIGYLGNLYVHEKTFEGKGIQLLIEALRDILSVHTNTLFMVVGAKKGERHIFAPLPEKRLRIVGPLDHKAFVDHLAAADILVIPYPQTYHYDMCVSESKLFEYMASGKPIITTRRRATVEVLTDGQNALLVDYSKDAFVRSITALIENRGLKYSLSRNAKSTARYHSFRGKARAILKRLNEFELGGKVSDEN